MSVVKERRKQPATPAAFFVEASEMSLLWGLSTEGWPSLVPNGERLDDNC
jgi:hypothetical protein